jgi:Protein of unknown function (DUF3489)
MRFEVTSDDHILRIREGLATKADRHRARFATEQELQETAGAWPMKRLVAIWNRLPGVQPVQKFENRQIAMQRIWRAIQRTEQSGATLVRASRTRTSGRSRIAFREGSKAAQVWTLLDRPEGVTLREIMTATGWQAHTVRGFLSRNLRRQGSSSLSFERDGERVYRRLP